MAGKSAHAFRTIGELSGDLGVPQHILRYWETRFPQLKPLQRAGNRRYYRPDDVALARRIHCLLTEEGYTIKGVQRVLAEGTAPAQAAPAPPPGKGTGSSAPAHRQPEASVEALQSLRAALAKALEDSRA